MRFMMLVIGKGYETAASDAAPNVEDFSRMMEFNKSLEKAGVLLAMDGLTPPSTGARISFNNNKATVTDGPFAEAKETIGGYWIIQARSREEAIEWAKRAPMGNDAIIEVRQIRGLADFSTDVQDVLAKRYEYLKKEAAAQA
jgi:hypothetical protein